MDDASLADLLSLDRVLLGRAAAGWEDAVRQVGAVLLSAGAVTDGYADAMVDRERSVSTYVGEGVAIPHGTLASRDLVTHDALCVVQYPGGVDWHGDEVVLCIGIAARGEGHVPILARLAELLMEPDRAAALRGATTPAEVVALLTPDDMPAEAPPSDEAVARAADDEAAGTGSKAAVDEDNLASPRGSS
jgi:PTS system mannitol-specific IIA component